MPLDEVKRALAPYVNTDFAPVAEFLKDCSHIAESKRYIDVGDFSKRCDCDLGDLFDCMAYSRVFDTLHCGPMLDVTPLY